jgi:hypothetical protein
LIVAKKNQPPSAGDVPPVSIRSIGVSNPATDDVGTVMRAGDPGPAEPLICQLRGTFNYTPDYFVDGIKVLTTKSDNAGASAGDPFSSAAEEIAAVVAFGVDVLDSNIDRPNGRWSHDAAVSANIDRDPNDTWNHISAVALVSIVNSEAPSLPNSALLHHHQWKARPADNCPTAEAPPHGSPRTRETRRDPSAPLLQPLEICDGWIRYSFFGRGEPIPLHGYQLASPFCCDNPLQARSLAIYAGEVNWQPRSDSLLRICRAHGIFDTTPVDGAAHRFMQFTNGIPKFSLVVHQLRHSSTQEIVCAAVNSECRDRPHRVELDPARQFFVHVNNVRDDRTKSTGTLAFWVKVLS